MLVQLANHMISLKVQIINIDMKKILLVGLLVFLSFIGYSQAPTYINGPTTIFAASGTVWYGDVTFGPNAVVYLEDGATPIFFGKHMVVDPAATFISLPGGNQTGTSRIIFRDNNPIYPGYPLQQTLNGGYSTGTDPSLLNIEIDNTLGLSLTGNTRITNTVLFTKGHIYLNNFNLVLDNDATLNSFDVSKHVVTNGTGVVVKEGVANGASFLFPISIAGLDYTPATITNTAATRNIHVQVKNYTSSAALETTFATKGMDRTWQVYSNIAGSATVSLQHNTLANANGASSDESAFINTMAYVSQQLTPGLWSQSCTGTNGGSPVSVNAGTSLILPATVDATAFFTKQAVSCVDLRVVKTTNNATPIIGANLTFTITVSNLSTIGATGVEVIDILPSGYTFVSATPSVGAYNSATGVWTIGNVVNGVNPTLNMLVTVNAAGNYSNTATVAGNEVDPVPANNTSTVSPVPGVPQANLAIAKTVNNTTPLVGSQVVFTIVASNDGPNDATGAYVTDLLPNGYTYVSSTTTIGAYNPVTGLWTIGNLANGGVQTLTITAQVNATGTYVNTAAIQGNELDPQLGNNTSTSTPIPKVLTADLKVVKTVNTNTPTIGGNVVFSISASNMGPDNATGVSVTDLLPLGYTYVSATASTGSYVNATGLWTIGALANAANATLSITATVNATGTYVNTAVIKGAENDPDLSNNTSTVSPVPASTASANLAVVKAVNNPNPIFGTDVVFTIVARNLGPNNATGVTVTDLLPLGYTYVGSTVSTGTYNNNTGQWAIGNLANGANTTLTITAKVNATGPYANTATIAGNEGDPDLTNNSSTVTPVPGTTQANLAVLKTVNNATPLVGSDVVFTIVASNMGLGNATGVRVTDLLPVGYTFVSSTVTSGTFSNTNGLWTVGNLASGTSATLTITAKVNAVGPYANTASVTGNEPDPDLNNNTSTVTPLPTTGAVNVSIEKTATNASINLGDTFDYTIVVKNIGGAMATEVVAIDVLPDGITYVSSSVTSGTTNYAPGTRTLTWNIGSLAIGATTTLTLKVTADKVGNIVNSASVKVKEIETVITDNNSVIGKEILGFNIPNVITPNGDGKNDTFFIDGLGVYAENNLIIFNRWNNEVFNSQGNYKNNWTGDGLNDGSYYYLLRIKDKSGVWQSLTGYITLLRRN